VESLPSYGRRLRRASATEYKKFWSGYRLLVTFSGLAAPLLLQVERGTHSLLSLSEVVQTGAVGFSLSLIGTYLYSRHKGAESLDAQRQEQFKQTEEALTAEKQITKRLAEEVEELRKPKRTAFQEEEYARIKTLIESYDEHHLLVLRHLLRHGAISQHHSGGIGPHPPGLALELAVSILNDLASDALVTKQTDYITGGWVVNWQIASGIRPVLEELV
jgi:hypothetical protein